MPVPKSDSDLDKFSRLVEALRPWLAKVVFVGGWAHRLYRERPEAITLAYQALRTKDADIALDPMLFTRSDEISTRLLDRGFTQRMSGDERPPVSHYHLGHEALGFYAEFLTPLRGSERRRDGSPDATHRVGGVVAQKLRYLDVLLVDPWVVTLSDTNRFTLEQPAVVQVPNPLRFIVQKLLVLPRRNRSDQAKDVLYIHDTIELFAATLDALNHVWRSSLLPHLSPSARRSVARRVAQLSGPVSDTVRESSLIASERSLTAASIRDVCAIGLSRMFR